MNWEDEGFLLSKIKFRENANIVNVFSNKRGKVSGIIYGGTSRKIRNFRQISNKIFIIHSSKSENRLGYFKTELIEAMSKPVDAEIWVPGVILAAESVKALVEGTESRGVTELKSKKVFIE